ncbi:hypothetical protein [Planomicrobium soli]|uniref:hypothetical protein n=1 Tax=Planomicrobium soli TaxID=1176648 RepID=UPI000D0D1571|nr:hypothetical protein [Planomicrobium soli]
MSVLDQIPTIMPGAVVNAAASIGRHTIVNLRTMVERDFRNGNFIYISPGAAIAGSAKNRGMALIRTEDAILPMIEVGQ